MFRADESAIRMKVHGNCAASCFAVVLVFSLIGARAGAEVDQSRPDGRSEEDSLPVQTILQTDLVSSLNPKGIMLTQGGYRRWIGGRDEKFGIPSSYIQAGFELGINPAYGQAALHVEWMPAVFAKLHLRYDLYGFFGVNGALLSFPSADSAFGEDEIDAQEGKEEAAFGQRVMLRPVLFARGGPVIIRNQTDLAYYRFNGKGPYFYEWEYDTLLKDGDYLIDDRIQFLVNPWRGKGDATILIGPSYEVTHAFGADLTRQRLGGVLFWVPADSLLSVNRPRIYSQLGVNLQDRNRAGQLYFSFGIGFDLDL